MTNPMPLFYPELTHVDPDYPAKVMNRNSGIIHDVVNHPYTLCGKEVVLDPDNDLPFGIKRRTVFAMVVAYHLRITCRSCAKSRELGGT